jgi:DNA-binding SARP family transcriptional activator
VTRPKLQLRLFGQFRLECPPGYRSITTPSATRRALISYLALQQRRSTREELATLLWPEKTEEHARQSLRQLLLETRASFSRLDLEIIQADRAVVNLNYDAMDVDVRRFSSLADMDTPACLAAAAGLYSGHLLQDFVLDVPPFDEWLSEQRTRLAFKAAAVFQQLVSLYNRDRRAAEAIRIAERWVEIDFLNEPAQRLLLRQLASYKGKEAALNHALRFVEQLRQQLSTHPEPETVRLIGEIRSGQLIGALQPGPIGYREDSKASLVSEGERKLVTILVGSLDLARFSDLEDAHTHFGAILPGVKATIEKYDGTLSQALPDGFAAIFGAPTSHEDHAVRASCAALEIHEQLALQGGSQPVRYRVGISSGEVVLKPLGGDSGQCYSVIGSAYQIASLVHQLAAPGMTILTHLTHELGQGVLRCAVRPPLSLPSHARPLQLHQLIGVDANRPRLQEENIVPLVGRGRQLTQLCGLAEQVSKGEGGRIVAVIGEAGIGKSRLCYEFSELLKPKRWRILQARTASVGQPAPLNTFISLLRGLLGILPEEDKPIVLHKVRSRISLDDANRFFVPAVLSLLGVASESDIWEQLEPTEKRRHTSEAVITLLLQESTSGPIMILIEDMHWLLSESKMLLDTLVSRITPGRLLLVVNYRSGYDDGWSKNPRCHRLRLEPLSPSSADQLVTRLLGSHPSLAATKEMLIQRAEGNPLFLEESVRSLIDDGMVKEKCDTFIADEVQVSRFRLPATVQSILAARISRLQAVDRNLLESAAIIGREFSLASLKAITELSDTEIDASLKRLRSADFLRRIPRGYTFKHVLTHEVAYGSILKDRRRKLHGRLLTALENLFADRIEQHIDRLAHHAYKAELWASAARYYFRAGASANLRSAHREAQSFLEKALSALEHLPETQETVEAAIDYRLQLRLALQPLADTARVEQLLTEAHALASGISDRARLARINSLFITLNMVRGEYERVIALSRQSGKSDEVGTRAHGLASLGASLQGLGRHNDAVAAFRQAMALLPGDLSYRRFEFLLLPSVYAHAGMAISLAELGSFPQAIQVGTQSVEIAEKLCPTGGANLAYALIGLGRAHLRRGNGRDARSALQRCLVMCGEQGLTFYKLVAAPLLGEAFLLGDTPELAIELLQPIKETESHLNIRNSQAMTLSVLSQAMLRNGRALAAAELAKNALQVARSRRQRGLEGWVLRGLGELASCEPHSRPTVAKRWYSEALAAAGECGMRPLLAHCEMGLAKLCAAAGHRSKSQQHFDAAMGLYREMGMEFWVRQSARALELDGAHTR